MPELFDKFPYLENDKIIIRKIEISDLPALKEISDNENVYKYVPYFLYKKSEKVLETAIRNIGGRDFIKKKQIIAGIYSKDASDKLVGLAEMFDYKKRENAITVGYRLNESYWNQRIATRALALMVKYLVEEIGIATLKAFVMPENIHSAKVLLKNGFVKENYTTEEKNWGVRNGLSLMYIPTRNPRRVYKREDNGYKIIRNVNLSEQNPA